MERRKPLRRTAPLRSSSRLSRKTPLRRASIAATGERAVRRRARYTGPDPDTRLTVLRRDGYRCVVCGASILRLLWSLHHRRNRGSGGSSDPEINSPSNVVTVCGDGSRGCHGRLTENPAAAIADGFSVSLNARFSPAEVPIQHAVHGRVLLDDNGGWRPAPPDAAPDTERRAA